MSKKRTDTRIRILAQKWLAGSSTREEREEFMRWYNHSDDNLSVPVPEYYAKDEEQHKEKIFTAIRERLTPENKKRPLHRIYSRKIWGIAATVLCLIGVGFYFVLFKSSASSAPNVVKLQINDLPPGGNRAVLTLANGTQVDLDSVNKGTLASQGSSKVIKQDSNVLMYNSSVASSFKTGVNSPAIAYNTLTTPRGGQYRLILADGTKVWLNAASSIRYPTVFTGAERSVEITGEAYFEVAKVASHPFRVKVHGVQVDVLGTQFNVMAYSNENAMRTTLVQGSVKVTQPDKGLYKILTPGEQARIDNKNGTFTLIDHADVRLATAWKDGVQAFRNADIETIMHQVERWYDVDVIYKAKMPKRSFSGEIPRNVSLAELLKLFEINNIHFIIDAAKKKLTVLP